MQAVQLKTEHMKKPIGIDIVQPFFSWTCVGDLRQTAYEICATVNETVIWNSGKVATSAMQATFGGTLQSRQRVAWRVRLWNEADEAGEWSEPAVFETAFLQKSDWNAEWICPELALASDKSSEKQDKNAKKPQRPASYLKRSFAAENTQNARLYITAHGVYVVYLNGSRIGENVLTPGPGSYGKKLCYQTYDVTNLLQQGENELLIALGDGWYRSYSGVDGDFDLYGTDLALLCQLEADGKPLCFTDKTWQATQHGPATDNDMQQGEQYDARFETLATGWHPVRVEAFDMQNLVCSNSVPVVENEAFTGKLLTTPNGETVLDFGQNMAGYVAFTVSAHAGDRIVLWHGETLDENGNFTQSNFQPGDRHREGEIRQKIEYICKEGMNHYKPSFTIMGFQYAKLETNLPPESIAFTAYAVYSEMEQLASFECSNSALNKLVQNSIWSQKSNFCEVPTDCPTRERAGWTGDAGVFVDTGITLMDSLPVFRKWLGECRSIQKADGKVYNIAPPNKKINFMSEMLSTSVGWGDASIIVPYALYKRTGDLHILEENYDMMRNWYTFLENRAKKTKLKNIFAKNPYKKYTVDTGMDYGEWCEPGMDARTSMADQKKSVGTAYLAQSGQMMSEIASILGKHEEASHYAQVSAKAKQAYWHAFTNNGKIESTHQCEYVRALKFGLLDEADAKQAAETLNALVVGNDYHLNTGFLSTPFLCEMLVQYGYIDTAYRLLLQDTQPSWLYAVKQGANTIWETWDGVSKNGAVKDSLNHYSYGVISGWLVSGVCGIQLQNGTITIKPCPNKQLGFASARYDSPVGRIESRWRYEGETVVYEFTVPANTTANITLANGKTAQLAPGKHVLS